MGDTVFIDGEFYNVLAIASAAPFYCFMLRRFHFLVVMTTGSVISSAGLIGSSLASHGNHLIFCYTMLAGLFEMSSSLTICFRQLFLLLNSV